MIHRLIHSILETGIQAYQNEPKMLDTLFSDLYILDSTEIDSIKTYFLDKGLHVYTGYPRLDAEMPFVTVILSSEGETETVMGQYLGMVDDSGDTLYGADIEGAFWEHNYNLPVVSEHPDITAYMYELVKSIMFAGIKTLVEANCFQFGFTGQDLAPDPKYLPERVFIRQLSIRLQRQFAWVDRDSRLSKAFQVAGIHVDSSASSGDVGEVETLVTPYTEDDE